MQLMPLTPWFLLSHTRSYCRGVVIGCLVSAIAALFVLTASGPVQAADDYQSFNPFAGDPFPVIPLHDGILVVGSEQDYPPFSTGMTDETAGGFTVDLWKAVATEVGLKYSIHVRPFRQILKEFKEGKVDVLINLARSKERSLFADFTVPHVIVHGAIFVRKGETGIRSENDLAGKSIIVLNADLAHDYAVSKGWGKRLILVDTSAEGMSLLASGKHDAMLLSKLAGLQTLQTLKLTNVEPLKFKVGFSQKFAFAVPKGQSELLALINEGLALTKANGIYNELYDQWFGVYEHEKDRLGYLLPLTGMFLTITGYLYYRRQLLFTDISQMKEHQEQLEQFAHYDALTALPNRVLLADRLQQAMIRNMRNNTSLAVVFLDLDGFKQVNDKHGHNLGDQLLVALTHRMKNALREGDTLARFGGDEFVAVLVDLEQPQDCKPVLSRLLEATSAPVTIDDMMLQVSASLGVTVYPQDNADAEQLMRHADQAMYQAKQTGKNCYHLFDVDHDAAVKTRHESLEHIRHALERGEFVLYYQPKVNMKTGKVIGAEALVRWQHPERGLLAPALFLPIIENHPIIVELGEWVIDSALAQIAEWDVAGLDIEVSVNIGARQLLYGNFESRLAELLAGHPGVRPNNLVLEILETSALQDITQVSKCMHACRDMGICFALDDFGTGYSSLTYLKHLPADIVKIDQSFVRDMIDYPDDRTIVQGVIELAKAFRRSVIAEGVETIMHGEVLLSLGCDQAQGYAIAHPMSAAEIPEWIANWRPDAAWTADAT